MLAKMSSNQPQMNTNQDLNFDEKQWVIHISRTLEEEIEDETETLITIFTVPKPLKDIHLNSYIPQQVSIGPYHYTRCEIHDMERYKLAAAKRNQKDFKILKLHNLVEVLMKFEPKIRSSYQRLLDFSGETLAWMMAVDASFLLEFLQVCAVNKDKATTNVISARITRLAHLGRNKAVHNAILRDITLVENQIPLFVLRKLLELYYSSPDKADDLLFSLLVGVCEELSPFKKVEGSACDIVKVKEFDHLLDFLYRFVVPKVGDAGRLEEEALVENEIVEEQEQEPSTFQPGDKKFLHKVNSKVSHLDKTITSIKKIIFSKPVKVIVKLPWTILSSLPRFKVFKQPLENFVESLSQNQKEGDETAKTGLMVLKSPLLEEIEIPSVTRLADSGITFQATDQGISSISYDGKTRTFILPKINLNVNSAVVLRNLVAYEACSTSGQLVLARYTELMNGIIDTEEDAKYLCERGIIANRLKSDEEVANMWNGMSKSIRLTKVPFLDQVIEEVNKDYSRRWKVKLGKYVKTYVYGSWKLLTFLGAILMILLMALQAFCSVYNCARVVPIKNLS